MRTFLYIVCGLVIGGMLCIGIAWIIGAVYGPLYQGEAESARNFKIFLLLFSISLAAGGAGGYGLSRRNL